jgi:hypothetical protein
MGVFSRQSNLFGNILRLDTSTAAAIDITTTNHNGTPVEVRPNPQDDVVLPATTTTPTAGEDPLGISTSSSRTTRATNVPLQLRDSRREPHSLLLLLPDDDDDDDDEDGTSATTTNDDRRPLLDAPDDAPPKKKSSQPSTPMVTGGLVRVRKPTTHKRRRRKSNDDTTDDDDAPNNNNNSHHPHRRNNNNNNMNTNNNNNNACLLWCCRNNLLAVQNTVRCMNVAAVLLLWMAITALVLATFWYSYELFNHGYVCVCTFIRPCVYRLYALVGGLECVCVCVCSTHSFRSTQPTKTRSTEPHLIAWFSAGAFVLLGFPISMWGIVGHLANYNQPHVQVYIVRILFMVPVYSVESWLAMRFHKHAIYIETLRDFYESYVLYSFLQFLIHVLGGEEALILSLKDKSPTRGFHMWGFQYCLRPWLMGQPVRKIVYERKAANDGHHHREIKRIHWKSPFFIKCKFGVLQYVLLKFLTACAVLLLEFKGWYREGEFSWTSGYFYICALTNMSQCWALYCLIFFYYATRTELGPIRPVGKFLSVKALVFFTWWQSVVIALLYQGGMIPDTLVNEKQDITKEDVAKGIQDYLICMEMFVAAIVHSFVFPHTEYSPQAVQARSRALNQAPIQWHKHKRLGRSKQYSNYMYDAAGGGPLWKNRDDFSKSSGMGVEMMSVDSGQGSMHTAETWEDPSLWHPVHPQPATPSNNSNYNNNSYSRATDITSNASPIAFELASLGAAASEDEEVGLSVHHSLTPVMDDEDEDDNGGIADSDEDDDQDYESVDETSVGDDDEDGEEQVVVITKPGFVRAFFDTAIPRDLGDSTIGLVKGEYHVEKKTLLHHAATSDQYDLFSPNRRRKDKK